ncbi:hypothetical protein Hamer_G018891 [Homarus americanus]|uniref:Uncharacterized protein n=1 Tax=Homarus americanus TaxID=6706 RepID=A0A8J5TBD2_HOMAM|nr:hypothetical protein Hamer_G018891 [Homarus americanus]
MEKQLEQLTALMMQQAEMVKQAQENSQRREERLSQILEHVVSQQEPSNHNTTTTSGAAATSSVASRQTKFPFGAAPALHLSFLSSLRKFDAWRHKFKGYMTLTKISSLSPAEQRAELVSVLNDEWTRILRYRIGVADDTELEPVLDAIKAYLRGERNVIVDRRDSYSRVQEPGETFDDFLCAVKEIANFCDFCESCIDNRLRDRIVVGTRDEEALKRMLEEKDLKLQSAINIFRASEDANVSSPVIRVSASHTLAKVSR